MPKLIHLESVLMPNGEIICLGKTIAMQKDVADYIHEPPSPSLRSLPRTIIVETSGGVVNDVHGLPQGWDWKVADWDEAQGNETIAEQVNLAIEDAKAQNNV